jgi:hypothetical protein
MFDGIEVYVGAASALAACLFVFCWWFVVWWRQARQEEDSESMRQKAIFRAGRAAEAKLLACRGKIFKADDVFVDIRISGWHRWTTPERMGKGASVLEKKVPLLEDYQREDSTTITERIHYIALLAGESAEVKSDAQLADESKPAIVLWHGYGLGAGVLAKAVEELAAAFPGQSVYAPGLARLRPQFAPSLASRPAAVFVSEH